MEKLLASVGGIAFLVVVSLIWFPGGTIFMALICKSRSLDGLDWVLSVVIPAFGLVSGLSCL